MAERRAGRDDRAADDAAGFCRGRELAERHRNHWNEGNIQRFWVGKTYDEPGDGSELSYSLGEILVTLVSEKGTAFAGFVQAADWRDAGQDAAVNFLGQGLEEVLAGFLGPGDGYATQGHQRSAGFHVPGLTPWIRPGQ